MMGDRIPAGETGGVGVGDLVLGWAHGGTVRHEFLASLLDLRGSPQWGMVRRVEAVSAGTAVAHARDTLCEIFLDGPEQWLLMVDTDVVFTPRVITRLAAAADPEAVPVVSGLVLYLPDVTRGLPVPAIYDRADPETPGEPAGWRMRRTWPAGDLTRVDGCGAACLLIHRSALEQVADASGARAWFRQVHSGPHVMGEDLSFCARLQACGIPLHVDTGARCGHMKTVRLGDPA